MANELRRRSLKMMLKLGQHEPPSINFDDAHRIAMKELVRDYRLDTFSDLDIETIAHDVPHQFKCWPDFPPALAKLRRHRMVASFTVLSYRLVMDTAKVNDLSWDAVFSCEGIGKYKTLPESYLTVAKYLQLRPDQICMVACHDFDLDAARAVGFKTAFVRRTDEWGPGSAQDLTTNRANDFIFDDFSKLAETFKETCTGRNS
ncbi:MAG: hypothetical protein JXQ99_03575 [Hyphomicrobiaceae bacterium]